MSLDDATRRQIEAALPDRSTWLSANAGSGKTRVLIDRVTRLLLTGVPPQNILCLTFTKAAAGEMQNRLFKRLGAWALAPADDLRGELATLGAPGDLDLDHARTLFARAVETPGGLKIQTIHSFCGSILRSFPREAELGPGFREIDDEEAGRLIAGVLEDIAVEVPAALTRFLAFWSGDELEGFCREILAQRDGFGPLSDDEILAQAGLPPAEEPETRRLLTEAGGIVAQAMPHLLAGSANDVKAAAKLTGVQFDGPEDAAVSVLEGLFLWGATATRNAPFSAKTGSFPTKATRVALGGLTEELDRLMLWVEDHRRARLASLAARRTLALHGFAAEFLGRYGHAKALRGVVDFDDLIRKCRDLLNDPVMSDWVLYRLDARIDHILVDEAQDTSPAQWDVIRRLAEEMISGQGARSDRPRTLFVVGDKKQSIYSFQGADASSMDREQGWFAGRMQDGIAALELEHSFRSAGTVLATVDRTFEGKPTTPEMTHRAFHGEFPGRVDLWPLIEPQEREDDLEWYDARDQVGRSDPAALLAERIAAQIGAAVAQETIPLAKGGRRRVSYGDFLILVQGRNKLFHQIIRACKAAGHRVAGADRLRLSSELAVRDLVALLNFLALPEDDLSLATALRSPLFRWSEAELYDLAHDRGGEYLWQTLRGQREQHRETVTILDDLRRNVDFLRPYELIERILQQHRGREMLIARLGIEAEDGIDELLNQALRFEEMQVPDLSGFLAWQEAQTADKQRVPDEAGDAIRVMTVHGSKGLESPIVILPDTLRRETTGTPVLVRRGEGPAVWLSARESRSAELEAYAEEAALADAEERQRLLYVAMTRAESWLIVCGAGKEPSGCWYADVRGGLEKAGAEARDFFGAGPDGLRLEGPGWADGAMVAAADRPEASVELPDCVREKASVPQRQAILTPSALPGAKTLPGEADALALDRGVLAHLLLERLPELPREAWEVEARRLSELAGMDDPGIVGSVFETLAVPEIDALMRAPALAEVPVAGRLEAAGGRRFEGVIDRLVDLGDRILILDYKTNAVVPGSAGDVPEGLLAQMGAYLSAAEEIFPDRTVACAILWVRGGRLMTLENDIVRRAFIAATTS